MGETKRKIGRERELRDGKKERKKRGKEGKEEVKEKVRDFIKREKKRG